MDAMTFAKARIVLKTVRELILMQIFTDDDLSDIGKICIRAIERKGA